MVGILNLKIFYNLQLNVLLGLYPTLETFEMAYTPEQREFARIAFGLGNNDTVVAVVDKTEQEVFCKLFLLLKLIT
jgi:hypothetical protein